VGLVWYPSARMATPTGVVVSGYATESNSDFGKLPNVEAKLAASRAAVEKLHPGYGKHLTKPIYVNWARVPENLGSWVDRGMNGEYHEGPYKEFCTPDDRFYFAGDHCAHVGAWQEGAALSAHRALTMIGERVKSERLSGVAKPTAA
jgi:monoamine oxidase